MSNGADTETNNNNNNNGVTWTTWEELLLAFAVKRHGLKDWETVAMELQNRHNRSSSSFTAQNCKDKYRNLRRRFMNRHRKDAGDENNELAYGAESDGDDNNDATGGGGGVGSDEKSFSWLEELRKLRVAELKQEVQRYDLSIESLQMKVKTMEEEREKSSEENQNGGVKKPDLDEKIKEERSENDKSNGEKDSPNEVAGKSVSGEDENRSFNESNSTDNRRPGLKEEPEAEPAEVKPDPELKPAGEEDSCNDSSDRHEVGKTSQERDKDGVDSGELRDSVAESKEGSQGTKESSDVQSSASLMTRKRKRRDVVEGGGGAGGGGGEAATVVSPATVPIKRESGGSVRSEPLVGFLDNIRSDKLGLVFESRLESQKTDKYKNIIRQHVDLETIQARVDDGSYSSCTTKFYVDLLLLFNNAIVFFPKSSTESRAAHDLRQLVMKELKKRPADPSREPSPVRLQPKTELERSDSLLAKQKSSAPIIVCRKRSSISAKASSSVNKVEKQDEDKSLSNSKQPIKSSLSTSNEDEGSIKLKVKEKPVTGVRSMRRSSSGRPNVNNSHSVLNSNQKPSSSSQQPDTTEKAESSKADKKKSEVNATVKKRGAADFLNRIKKNDPAKGTLVEALKNSVDNFKSGRRDQHSKKSDERKDGNMKRSGGGKSTKDDSPSKRNVGRPPKKGKDAVVGKRGRDGGEAEGSSKRPKKRSRR